MYLLFFKFSEMKIYKQYFNIVYFLQQHKLYHKQMKGKIVKLNSGT